MARRVGVLPVVMGQFAAGRLSVDQVAVVARHAPSHVEASVAELAVSASVPQLGRVLSRYAFDPPTGDDPDPGSGGGGRRGRCRRSRSRCGGGAGVGGGGSGGGAGGAVDGCPGGWPVRAAVQCAGRCRGAGGGGGVRGSGRAVRRGCAAGDVGRCAGAGVSPLAGVGDLARPAGLLPGVCASGRRGWLVERAAAAAAASGGQADVCGVGAAVVGARRGCRSVWGGRCGSCRSGPAGWCWTGTGGAAFPDVWRGRIWRCITWSTGPTAAGRTWTTWPGCARSTTTPTTVASSRSPAMRTLPVGWCSWPAAGSRSGRARPTPRQHPGAGRPPTPGSAGRVYTIGVSTPDPEIVCVSA